MRTTDLTIRQLGPQGDGIHQGPHGRIYVERALPGERLKARVHRDRMGLMRAEIVKLLEPSPYRQKPPCPHFEQCGNCTLQHLSEAGYRAWKIALVKDAFRRVGLCPQRWLDPAFIPSHSRRRLTFTACRRGGQLVLGYYRRRSRAVGEIETCLVADPQLWALRETLKPLLASVLAEGKTVDIFLQKVGDAVDMVLTGPVGENGVPDAKVRRVVSGLAGASPVRRVSWRAHERERIETLWLLGTLNARFGVLEVELPPAAFLQPTEAGERALVQAVLAALPAGHRFADLFSGCGTFAGPLLKRGAVDAYESVPAAVQALARAGAGHRLSSQRRDLFQNPLRREELNRYDAIVFDPPRAGCTEQAQQMASARTPVLIGISCNPATFARDSRLLCRGGYRLQSLQVVDQFLWSHHVEVVGVFTKGSGSRNIGRCEARGRVDSGKTKRRSNPPSQVRPF